VFRSSTSSSRGPLPIAGALAVVLLVVLDAIGPTLLPWKAIYEAISRPYIVEMGVARDQLLLSEARAAPADAVRIFIVGSSRMQAAFIPALAGSGEWAPRPVHVAKLTHPGIDLYGIRSLADALADYDPGLVVVMASEFDTHVPLRPRAVVSYGSPSAVAQLARGVGVPASREDLELIERLGLASFFEGYRFRDVLQRAGGNRLRVFEFGMDPATFARLEEGHYLLDPGDRTPLDPVRALALTAEFEARFEGQRVWGAGKTAEVLQKLGHGEHVAVQMELLEEAVARLREAGAQVLLVEGPLSPIALEYYDPSLREEFRRFGERLAEAPGVEFLSAPEMGDFVESDFVDLNHASVSGARRVTRAVLERMGRMLETAS
jgi:hypothetical protein